MSIMDLFRPEWKSSNPDIRRKALLKEQDLQILIEALKSEEDESITSAVVGEILSVEVLEQLNSAGIAEVQINKKLHNLYIQQALKCNSVEEIPFGKLDARQLGRLAREGLSQEVQLKAIEELNEVDTLSGVVQNTEKKIAQKALEKITGKDVLNKLAKSARHKGTRLLARKRYDELYGEEEKAQERKDDGERKLEKILKVLEGMATLPDWTNLLKDYEAELSKWRDLSEFVTDDLNDRYKIACENCLKRKEDFEKEEAARVAARKILDERTSKRRSLVQDLLSAAETLQDNSVDILADFKGRWEVLGDTESDEEKEAAKRFEKAVKSFDAKQEVLKDFAAKESEQKAKLLEIKISLDELKASENSLQEKIGKFNALKGSFRSVSSAAKDKFIEIVEEIEKSLNEFSTLVEAFKKEEEEKLVLAREKYQAALETVKSFESTSRESTEKVKELQKEWKEFPDLTGKEAERLNEKFRKACDQYFDKVKEYVEEREWNEFANQAAKEKLIVSLEALSAVEDPQELAKKIKECQTAWKEIGPVPHAVADELWDRFKSTGDKLYERCKAYFEEQESKREESRKVKEGIVEKAEAFAESEDWKGTAQELKNLQKEWKEAGSAPRKAEKELWDKFRSACDQFFNRRKEHFSEVDTERVENTARKEALIEAVEAAAQSEKLREASERIKQLQKEWKEIGPAQRNKENELWKRFRKAADDFFSKRKENYQKMQTGLEENAQEKIKVCDDLEEKLKDLNEESDWTAMSQLFKQVQKDWSKLPGAGHDKDKELWSRLRDICNRFFKARDDHFDKLSDSDRENLELKEEFCLKVELLGESSEWRETAEELKKLQAEFKELPSINEKYDSILYRRFNGICKTFFDRRREHFEERDETRKENLQKKKDLCKRMEELAGVQYTQADEAQNASVADMAAQLQDAFNNNFGGYEYLAEKPLSFRDAGQEVRELQAAWKEIGPVPKSDSQKIWERFRKAADTFYTKRKEFFSGKEKEYAANLEIKKAIIADLEKEAAKESADFGKVKSLQKKWRECGDVSRRDSKEIFTSFKKLCDRIYGSSKKTVEEEKGDVRI